MGRLSAEQRRILKGPLGRLSKEHRDDVETAVLAASEASGSFFLTEAVQGLRQRERRAWGIATLGLLLGVVGIGAGTYGIARTETQAYLALIDRDTGQVERAVTVERAAIEQSDAVVESLIYNYVLDRETYDVDDNEYRILSVFERSGARARQVIEAQWTPGSPNYPPDLYGPEGKVQITVNNVLLIDEDTAQVRFTKLLTKPNTTPATGDFVATVTFDFNPTVVDNNRLVWENPFGFQVTGYRVNSEGNSG